MCGLLGEAALDEESFHARSRVIYFFLWNEAFLFYYTDIKIHSSLVLLKQLLLICSNFRDCTDRTIPRSSRPLTPQNSASPFGSYLHSRSHWRLSLHTIFYSINTPYVSNHVGHRIHA